jgi:hypothetical protein
MPNITLALPKAVAQKMKRHPEIRWSRIARQAIEDRVKLLETLEETTDPSLSEEEAVELALKIHHSPRRKSDWRKFLTA